MDMDKICYMDEIEAGKNHDIKENDTVASIKIAIPLSKDSTSTETKLSKKMSKIMVNKMKHTQNKSKIIFPIKKERTRGNKSKSVFKPIPRIHCKRQR